MPFSEFGAKLFGARLVHNNCDGSSARMYVVRRILISVTGTCAFSHSRPTMLTAKFCTVETTTLKVSLFVVSDHDSNNHY
jgi:hypothetical protein